MVFCSLIREYTVNLPTSLFLPLVSSVKDVLSASNITLFSTRRPPRKKRKKNEKQKAFFFHLFLSPSRAVCLMSRIVMLARQVVNNLLNVEFIC